MEALMKPYIDMLYPYNIRRGDCYYDITEQASLPLYICIYRDTNELYRFIASKDIRNGAIFLTYNVYISKFEIIVV